MSMLLEVKDLKTHFHTRRGIVKAVDEVNIEIEQGQSVAIVGESGCGKSTLAASLMRLIPSPPGKIAGGQILFKGRDLLSLSEAEMRKVRGKEIAMVFQDPMTYLNPVMTAGDQIAETIRLHRNPSNVKQAVIGLLEQVRMPDAQRVAESYPHQLSGGMKQRVLIAMAIACNPSLLIADEPTTALDVTVQAQILSLIKDIVDDLGMTLVLITHDLGIVAEICDRAYVMYAGKVAEHGSVFQMFEDPKHPYTRGLLNSALSIDHFKENLVGIPGTVPDLISPPTGCRFRTRCSEAMDICQEQPPRVELGDRRQVYCSLYRGISYG